MTKSYEFQMEMLATQMTNVQRALDSMMQSPQAVSGKASALVALAKDSRLDGRVGAGDVVVSVMLAGGGLSIGVIGAAGIFFGGIDVLSTGEMFSLGTLTGCGLGLLRMGIDALAIPLMLSNLMEWGAERWQEWLELKREVTENPPESTREVPISVNGEPAGFVSLPEPTEFNVNTLKIESVNIVDGIREIEVDKVCLFLKSAAATGQWARDKQDILSQKEHPDVKAYLRGKGWWKISSPPALRACAELRGGVTNGTEPNGNERRNQ